MNYKFIKKIIYRWKLDKNGSIVKDSKTNKPILQFVAIQRTDTNEWAIPGVGFGKKLI